MQGGKGSPFVSPQKNQIFILEKAHAAVSDPFWNVHRQPNYRIAAPKSNYSSAFLHSFVHPRPKKWISIGVIGSPGFFHVCDILFLFTSTLLSNNDPFFREVGHTSSYKQFNENSSMLKIQSFALAYFIAAFAPNKLLISWPKIYVTWIILKGQNNR